MPDHARDADVIVVGAGPAGSTTAITRQPGLDVLLLEKTAFPRDKVCGDGLTPRAVKPDRHGCRHLPGEGLDPQQRPADRRRRPHLRAALAELERFPNYGLVRTRMDFDEILARHAAKPVPGWTSARRSSSRPGMSAPAASTGSSPSPSTTVAAPPAPGSRTVRRWWSPPTV